MKNFKTYLSLIFAGALALTACQDDFDDPGMANPESSWLTDGNYELRSINDVKTEFWEDADNYYKTIETAADGKHIIVKGRVISSDASGNIYKSLVIQDETGALAMSINANSMCNQYRRGQEIVVDLTGMTIGKYAGLQQLGAPEDSPQYGQQTTFMPYQLFVRHNQKNGQPDLAEVDTLEVRSLSEITGGPEVLRKWQSQLVRFNNCSFVEGGTAPFAESKETVNRSLTLSDGGTVVVRTSGYSNFYSTILPEGHGDVVGILSYHSNGGWQVLLLDRNGCMNFGNPTIGPGAEDNPYTVDQALSIITNGGTASNVWTTGYIVGAVAPGVTEVKSNADIQFSGEPDMDNTLVIAQSPDCTDWTKCMLISLPQGSKLRKYGNLRDNGGNYKKQMWIKGNFGSELEMPAITGNNGAADGFRIDGVEVPGGDEPTPGEGDGTKEKPYSVGQVIALNPNSTTSSPEGGTQVWVSGYIVGSMPTGGASTTLEGTEFSTKDAAVSNLVIAPTADCKDYKLCIGIQLPTQTVAPGVRSALNLKDNPGNLGKKVALFGDVMKYCGGPGLKNTSEFNLEGGSTPDVPAEAVSSLNEFFPGKVKPAGWTSKMIEGNKDWYYTEFNTTSYAAMTGYKGTAPFDSWLISPAVDMSKVSDKTLSFETQVNGYGSTTTQFEVYVLDSADPSTAGKTKLNPTIATAPASGYSSWVKSGSLDLSSFSGVIYVAFRYYATADANFATWCVTNVKLNAGGGGGEPDQPVNPDQPVVGDKADFNTMNNGVAAASPYGTLTSASGWVATNSLLLQGGAADGNPVFTVFGDDKVFAVCMNGKSGACGTLTSPTISGGLGTLKFDYCHPYSDNKCKLTINIKQNGSVVASDVLENNGMTKLTKYSYSHDFNISGDFVIEIVNNGPSGEAKNKDRVAVWNLTWSGK